MMTLITREGTPIQGMFKRLLQNRVKKAVTSRSGDSYFGLLVLCMNTCCCILYV